MPSAAAEAGAGALEASGGCPKSAGGSGGGGGGFSGGGGGGGNTGGPGPYYGAGGSGICAMALPVDSYFIEQINTLNVSVIDGYVKNAVGMVYDYTNKNNPILIETFTTNESGNTQRAAFSGFAALCFWSNGIYGGGIVAVLLAAFQASKRSGC